MSKVLEGRNIVSRVFKESGFGIIHHNVCAKSRRLEVELSAAVVSGSWKLENLVMARGRPRQHAAEGGAKIGQGSEVSKFCIEVTNC